MYSDYLIKTKFVPDNFLEISQTEKIRSSVIPVLGEFKFFDKNKSSNFGGIIILMCDFRPHRSARGTKIKRKIVVCVTVFTGQFENSKWSVVFIWRHFDHAV